MLQGRKTGLPAATALALILFLPGCFAGLPSRTPDGHEPASGPEVRPWEPPLDPVDVEKRVQDLEQMLSRDKDLGDEVRAEAEALLEDYLLVLRELRSRGPSPERRNTAEILFDRLGVLESRCFDASQKAAKGPEARPDLLLPREYEKIHDAYRSGDHEGVIRTCMDIQNAYGPEGLTPEAGKLFALSLGETGRTGEAIRVGGRVLAESDGLPDMWHLRARMVVWNQARGDSKQAMDHYESLAAGVSERKRGLESAEEALGPVLTGVGARSGEPAPPGGAQSERPGPLPDLTRRVEALLDTKAFDQARLLLVRQRIRYPEGIETAAIDSLMERVDRTEAASRLDRTSAPAPPALEDAINRARGFMEAEEYEEAIAALNGLQGSGVEHEPRVEDLRRRAETELVKSNREQAAKLFLMARNSGDPKEKEARLRASRELLKDLLTRFPESTMVSRVRSNLETVEREMSDMGLDLERSDRARD
jgi:hypothetical protein